MRPLGFAPLLLVACASSTRSPLATPPGTGAASVAIAGEARKWHTITLSFTGPRASHTDRAANPFLDHRLQVVFTAPDGRALSIPGFFDGDGAGGGAGGVWRVRFTPDTAGTWRYRVSFRTGPAVAIALEPQAGAPAAFDGAAGTLAVADRDPSAPGFLALGRLEHVGRHYLKFRDGPYWVKGGTDDPENFLAYAGFQNTAPGKFALHRYAAHERDFRPGDPDWGGGKGRGIIGAINYLATEKVNSLYFLPMNIGGDGQDTWPFVGPIAAAGSAANDDLHYDVGKLREWEIVFAHAQRRGLVLHLVLNEAEAANKKELDDATLGPERKLYYRELVARFAHHNAIVWNLCEEYNLALDLGPARVKEFAAYLRAQDPYGHPITVHNERDALGSWAPFLGDERFSLTSLQYHPKTKFGSLSYDDLVETLRAQSAAAGRPLPISVDEFDRLGATGDESRAEKWPYTSGYARLRKAVLWPIYLSGGQVEFILDKLLETEDFRRHEPMWRYTHHARKFLEQNLPFWEMEPEDALLSGAAPLYEGGQVFRKTGEVYAVYLPRAAPSGRLDLSRARGPFEKHWYNPRTGRFEGAAESVEAGGVIDLGAPPSAPEEDWALLFRALARAQSGGRASR